MGRTVLQMVNQAQRELGLPVSATVFGNEDVTTQQLLGFLTYSLEEIRKAPDTGWTHLQKEYDLAMPIAVDAYAVITQGSRIITIFPGVTILGITASNFTSWAISGTGIPPAARISSITDDHTLVMTMEATASSATSASIVTPDYIYDSFGNMVFDSFGDPILASTNTITTVMVADLIQFAQDTFTMPEDFDYYQNFTFWDRTNHWPIIGPTSPQIDQWHKSGIVATGPRRFYRQYGQYPNRFQLWPPPFELVNPMQIVFEYMSRFAVQVLGNLYSFAEYFANDSDTCLLDDRLLIMAMKWRFWEQKGMNWSSKRKEYDDRLSLLIAQDGSSPTLSLVLRRHSILISPANVQDGYFPG